MQQDVFVQNCPCWAHEKVLFLSLMFMHSHELLVNVFLERGPGPSTQ